MSTLGPDFLQRLGVVPDADERSVKRAYARILKGIDQVSESGRFEQLRSDYVNALEFVKNKPSPQGLNRTSTQPGPDHAKTPSPLDPTTESKERGIGERADDPASSDQSTGLEPPKLSQAPEPTHEEIAQAELQLFMKAIFALAASDRKGLTTCLQNQLLRDALVPLDVRDCFELALLRALARRQFVQHSGPLLLVTAEVFGWHTSDNRRPESCGKDGQLLARLLDDAHWGPTQIAERWILLAGEPIAKSAAQLLKESEEFESKSPLLFEYFFSDDHLLRWVFVRDYRPLYQRVIVGLLRRYRQSPLLQFVTPLGGFIAVTALVLMGLSSLGVKQAKQRNAVCDGLYASLIASKWRDVSFESIGGLETCAATAPPTICSDRDELMKILQLHRKLVANASYTSFFHQGLNLRTRDGLGYAFTGENVCDGAWSLAAQGNWIDFGDEAAARQLMKTIASCPTLRGFGDGNTQNLLKFLKRLDIWPDHPQNPKGGVIAYQSIVTPTPEANPDTVLLRRKVWPLCVASDNDLPPPSDDQSVLGPDQRKAIEARARSQ